MKHQEIIKTATEIDKIRSSAQVAAKVLEQLKNIIKPGISTQDIDNFCNDMFHEHGAISGCKGYEKFPKNICTSVNNALCHGIPNNKELKEGDIVTVDIVVKKEGYYSDTAYTYSVGQISEKDKNLIDGARAAMYAGIAQVKPDNTLLEIAKGIEESLLQDKFKNLSIVSQFCGHGVGLALHEPMLILNNMPTNKRERELCSVIMKPGMIFTIEPIITIGKTDIKLSFDNFTYLGSSNAAMFEHTILVTDTGYEVLTKRQSENI